MEKVKTEKSKKRIVLALILIALVIAIECVVQYFKIAIIVVPLSLALVPIIVGAATFGPLFGAFIGLLYGIIFFDFHLETFLYEMHHLFILGILLKGVIVGLVSGLIYKRIAKKKPLLASIISSAVSTILNGVMLIIGYVVLIASLATSNESLAEHMANLSYVSAMSLPGIMLELVICVLLCPILIAIFNKIKR